jgi:GTPase
MEPISCVLMSSEDKALTHACQVRAIEKHGRRVNIARAGDVVSLSFASGMDTDNIKIGHILCAAQYPIPLATVFLAQVLFPPPQTFDLPCLCRRL